MCWRGHSLFRRLTASVNLPVNCNVNASLGYVLQGKQQVLYPPHNKVTTHVFRGEPNMNQVKPVLLVKRDLDIPTWVQALNQQMPALEVRIWPELGDPSEIEFALLWMPPPELFTQLSNLEVIFSVGAGIDHLLACPSLPRNIPIVRMVEPGLTSGMVEYVLYNVLRFHRGMDRYDAQQRAAHWSVLPQISAEARSIGIMGLGMIGQAVAELLVTMGFKVHGWSQTRKVLPGVNSYVGEAERNAFLQNTEILVAVLPSTLATVGLIDARLLARLPRGAFLINVGRGDLIREGDLLHALDREHLAGAALDVFSQEPLPVGHPFWRHPRVSITPHVASITQADTAVAHVVTNIGRWQAGQTLSHVVDLEQGY